METNNKVPQGNTDDRQKQETANQTQSAASAHEQQSDKLVQQDEPLKNNDHDVDPENPMRSSLEHR